MPCIWAKVPFPACTAHARWSSAALTRHAENVATLRASPVRSPQSPCPCLNCAKHLRSTGTGTAKHKSRFCPHKGFQAAGQAGVRPGRTRLSGIAWWPLSAPSYRRGGTTTPPWNPPSQPHALPHNPAKNVRFGGITNSKRRIADIDRLLLTNLDLWAHALVIQEAS